MIRLLLDGCVRVTMLGLLGDQVVVGWVCESDKTPPPRDQIPFYSLLSGAHEKEER